MCMWFSFWGVLASEGYVVFVLNSLQLEVYVAFVGSILQFDMYVVFVRSILHVEVYVVFVMRRSAIIWSRVDDVFVSG